MHASDGLACNAKHSSALVTINTASINQKSQTLGGVLDLQYSSHNAAVTSHNHPYSACGGLVSLFVFVYLFVHPGGCPSPEAKTPVWHGAQTSLRPPALSHSQALCQRVNHSHAGQAQKVSLSFKPCASFHCSREVSRGRRTLLLIQPPGELIITHISHGEVHLLELESRERSKTAFEAHCSI